MKFQDVVQAGLFVYGRRMAGQRVLLSDVFIRLSEPLRHRARGAPQTSEVTALSLLGEHKQPPDQAVVSRVVPAEDMTVEVSDGRSFGSLGLLSGVAFFVWSSVTQVSHVELPQVCWQIRPPIVDEAQRIVRNLVGFDGNTYHADPADRVALVLVDGGFMVDEGKS